MSCILMMFGYAPDVRMYLVAVVEVKLKPFVIHDAVVLTSFAQFKYTTL